MVTMRKVLILLLLLMSCHAEAFGRYNRVMKYDRALKNWNLLEIDAIWA
jgi:hypothetical protein